MEKKTRLLDKSVYLAPILLLVTIAFVPHLHYSMPLHADSWITIDLSKEIIDSKKITFNSPFGGENIVYPRGSHILVAVLSLVSGLSLIEISNYLPPIIFAALGLSMYALAKILYSDSKAAFVVLVLTPFVISNSTMLGPDYLVPVAIGSVLVINYFYLLLSAKYRNPIFLLPALGVFVAV
ncbi:MAG: hypothetical protein ABH950_09960, partial [Candidatus Altiarchaeota archaeon]